MQKSISAFGIGLLSMGSIAVPTIAGATTTECGPAEEGKTLTFSNGVCQAEYSVAGEYAFTVPSGATELAAISVGGGGAVTGFESWYYAGNGGQVEYSDLSDPALVGTELELIVGAGGISFDEDLLNLNGGGSTIQNDSTSFSDPSGGVAGFNDYLAGYCDLVYDSGRITDIQEGFGSAGTPVYVDRNCSGTGGAGITPSVDAEDNFENSVPAIFQNYSVELGSGGYFTVSASDLVQGPGQGGSLKFSSADGSLITQSDGSDGLVVFRWKAPAAPASLAETGSGSNQWNLAGAAGLLMLAAGAAFSAIAYRAKRKSN